ncbi:MAG: phosphate ABC transporter permease subunit PstC [Brevundimonas sp.]|jgi:phosphate transport system permease protein|uniref:phosphate ABC transporter permease subunit PstC n=1 Tax=Brevundimonas TaxID=41275 RepID=UPI0006F58A26|nr:MULTISPECIES: phosphate ABC transporter permease subunit PstC [Brevundimonas]KQP44118.1 phosphate ABC transporter permease [Brevundimonas sp. Leaf280]MRL68238.1 phosphate ABC transporter permease subunit PstC [Brevundimonas sp. SPF441]NSX32670.1 phosphate ABC transporter permease subunit PstC [Brevundimonas vesicularis]QIF81287.1 phosphate ABC transporter permease subunit PstC [Brevundimonas sp. 'scallop']WBT07357.1 phosphate ABC transporter permease subunit PstC [Brevundimonas vesicularis]
MIWIYLLILVALSAAAFLGGRTLARRRAIGAKPHSRPGQHGAYALIWVAAPALLVLILASVFAAPLQRQLTAVGTPDAVAALEPFRRDAFFADAHRVGRGEAALQIWERPLAEQLPVEARRMVRIERTLSWGGGVAAILAAILGGLFALTQIKPQTRARNRVEGWIYGALFVCSAIAVLTTLGIIASLAFDSFRFFQKVPVLDFLFGTQWSPQIAIRADQVGSSGAFGAVPLFAGTLLIMVIAMCVAAPIGLLSAIYLSEYAGRTTRAVIKPLLEILAGVPTVVYGFFAALTVGPLLRVFFNEIGLFLIGGPLDGLGQYLALVQNQMALTAGAVMGIMLIPFVSSLSDDILNAVPQSLRDGSFAMGATKSETVKRVLLPAALPGIAGALLLAVSRAIGETMIVTMAAGLAANLTFNPLDTVTTVTVQIVTLLTGDQEFNSAKTLSAFGLGLTLFLVTLMLNIIAHRIVQTYREQYD